jgi:hypothetical protein
LTSRLERLVGALLAWGKAKDSIFVSRIDPVLPVRCLIATEQAGLPKVRRAGRDTGRFREAPRPSEDVGVTGAGARCVAGSPVWSAGS